MKRQIWWLGALAAVSILAAACSGQTDSKSASPAMSEQSRAAAAPANGASALAETPRDAAAPPSSQGGQPGQAGTAAQIPPLERKVITNEFLDLTVKDVRSTFQRISILAEASGGLVAESNLRQEGDKPRATIKVRIPAPVVQQTLVQIRELGNVDAERATSNDVTEEFTDLGSRQRTLEATEQQLLVFLGQAKNIQEVLQVQDRLNSVRTEIERIRGRLNAINRLTDLATVTIELRPESAPVTKKEPASGPLAGLEQGWDASLAVLGGLGYGLLTFAAFSWWLVPFAVIGFLIYQRERRRRRTTLPVAAAE